MNLTNYLEQIFTEDRRCFTTDELFKNVEIKESSLPAALSRLAKSGRLKMIKRGFGILLNSNKTEPHPSYYIDALMKHMETNYYVGLLAAASHWGASHQASMSYQIVADKVISKVSFEKGRIEFVVKKEIPTKGVMRVSGPGGYYLISSPELTAIDLFRFPKASGHLNNIATVLEDLSEKWDGRKMISLCHDPQVPTVLLQRLGYILDCVLNLKKESEYIKQALDKRRPAQMLLSFNKKMNGTKKSDFEYNEKWMLYLNTTVEPD